MTVPTDSLELGQFEPEIITKNKSLVEEIGMLQKTVTDVQAV